MTVQPAGSPSNVRDGDMLIEFDVPITVDDGLILRADVFRPADQRRHPAILSYGPYAKGLAFQEGYPDQWNRMLEDHPDVGRGSSNRYQNWEVVDPEKWVPDGYACVRVDSRGTGRSPGFVDLWSERETRDLYDCIEWAAAQPWCSGRVGLSGISYYAMNQYQVAALQPPHLAAILPWEGCSDWYRELAYHGGILCDFGGKWYPIQVTTVQHGVGERGARSPITGELVAGPETLSDAELAANRADFAGDLRRHSLFDDWYRERNPDWSRVTVPMLSSGNWGGQNLHLRGNTEAFANAAGPKWLELHGGAHWAQYYTDYGVALQKRFFGHFLKGDDTGWDTQPPVVLQVRHIPERYVERHETEWPLARTSWTRFHLDPAGFTLRARPVADVAKLTYDPTGDGLTFSTPPLTRDLEVTGPIVALLYISSSTADADLFLVVRVFDPAGNEVTFQGAVDPNTPISQGWLRASHRKLDPGRSRAERPYHTHDEVQPLTPGEVYELQVEVWPTCIVVPAGHRLAITVRGSDYRYEGELSAFARSFHYANRGVGPYTHADPGHRPPEVFAQPVTLHVGGRYPSHVLLPVIPAPGEPEVAIEAG